MFKSRIRDDFKMIISVAAINNNIFPNLKKKNCI